MFIRFETRSLAAQRASNSVAEDREPLTPDPPSSTSKCGIAGLRHRVLKIPVISQKPIDPSGLRLNYSESCSFTHINLCSIFARRSTHRDHPSACIFPFMLSANFPVNKIQPRASAHQLIMTIYGDNHLARGNIFAAQKWAGGGLFSIVLRVWGAMTK